MSDGRRDVVSVDENFANGLSPNSFSLVETTDERG
jgi:hypothetical protein